MTAEMPQRCFEDFEPGMVFEFGDYPMSEAEIIAFGRAYDPQPFHTEPSPPPGAGHSELIASGWHTAAVTMRMLVDHFIPRSTVLPSPGHDELRWMKPVRPGDRLSVKMTVISKRVSASKPDRGLVMASVETLNQDGDAVMRFSGPQFYRRRA